MTFAQSVRPTPKKLSSPQLSLSPDVLPAADHLSLIRYSIKENTIGPYRTASYASRSFCLASYIPTPRLSEWVHRYHTSTATIESRF
jgi:hypothetical protein